ncbi:hypothetical protein HN371_05845 [Candidatus Poribacteria bacterium]|nr:hypothetical protein [Candidatus Poribacteria bacterium]MBT5536174.1 hypothetical protein [Candidatus Poribacteria bacterium]MBT5713536.1 hypothetical protein [Candidatus Poribacteria bacterium]MBT7095932.1 hypothetical protein [Candidatus Poribacteria bacterium]MBT7809188.1 hypothetical protein [Candidatus Poribacteria bacterium]
MGYAIGGEHHAPGARIVSMYVDQFPENDLSRARAAEHGFTIYPTIAGAVRHGSHELSVDGVLVIGEHGDYPSNELGQTLYPRHEFFRQVTQVFKRDSRVAPVFVDKHLSYEYDKAAWMVDDSKRGGYPLLAGSSIPVAFRLPPLELPLGCEVEDALAVGYGGVDSYDFHALEGLQCMVERRKGGETGVRAVQYFQGDAVWAAGDDGVWSWDLLSAAMSRSDSPQGNAVDDGRPEDFVGLRHIRDHVANPGAYVIEYSDGTRATTLLLDGATRDFLFAAKLRGQDAPVSTQFFLTPIPNVDHFSGLVSKIEEMFVTGVAPYPAERTLLVSGVLEACIQARHEGTSRQETPSMAGLTYAPSPDSHYMRD